MWGLFDISANPPFLSAPSTALRPPSRRLLNNQTLYVRKCQLLLLDHGIIDEGTVYDETIADPNEETTLFSQLGGSHFLQLSQLVCQDTCATIGLRQGRIVAIRADVHDMIRSDSHQFVGGGYDEFWKFKGRYRVCKGSRASKKSKTTALNIIVRMMAYPLANTLVLRKYFST